MQTIVNLPIDKLKIDTMNIRNDYSLHGDNDTSIEELSLSIKSQGLLNPLSVRLDKDEQYIIFAGSRRFKALQLLNETVIPCIIHNISETEATTKSLIENFQRQDNSYSEKTRAFKKLWESQKKDINKLSVLVGVKVATLRRYLTISTLDDNILNSLDKRNGERRLTLEVAEKLVSFSDDNKNQIFDKYMNNNLTSKDMINILNMLDNTQSITSDIIDKTIDNIKIKEAEERELVEESKPYLLDQYGNKILIESVFMNKLYNFYTSLLEKPIETETYGSDIIVDQCTLLEKPLDFNVIDAFYLCFDTETTGTTINDEVIQLGYVICNKEKEIIYSYEKILQTDRKSNPFAYAVHNISHNLIHNSIYNQKTEIEKFLYIAHIVDKNNGVIIAHNAKFDERMIEQTGAKHNLRCNLKNIFCTMKAIRKIDSSLRGATCKNTDVYKFLGGKDIGIMHNALNDAKATLFIYFYGLGKKWW
jgi:ParB family chromosome partitioning protein